MSKSHFVSIPDIPAGEMQFYLSEEDEICSPRYFPAHIHDCIEVYLLMEGDVSFMVEGQLYNMKPGDAVFSRPNEIHNCILNSPSVHKHYCFWFRSDSDFLFGDFLRGKNNHANLLSPSSEEKRREVLSVAKELYLEHRKKNTLLEYAQTIRLISLWHACMNQNSIADNSLPNQLQEILDDISKNLAEIHNLSYFTEKYYLSPSQLRRMFCKYLQMPPKEYLENKRLAYSRGLLRKGASVTEACEESGFPDLSNYIRLFRIKFGITPAEYRRSEKSMMEPIVNKYI